MRSGNTYLQKAKSAKNDEFYTTYETIERELVHYERHFNGKVVLCNSDDPLQSNFCRYFLDNFHRLQLRRLICTAYTADSHDLFSGVPVKGKGLVLDVNNSTIIAAQNNITDFVKPLCGNGDFRSAECLSYMDECDIVVTNPPFSLFRKLVAELMRREKGFILIGNQNALTYKEIFPLIQQNRIWTGYQFGDMAFRVPSDTEPRATRYWQDITGQKWRSLGNAMWLTNLDIEKRHEWLPCTKTYTPEEYPKYDNYDAINVHTLKDIPCDYAGIMGVPVTIINKYNSEQFELVGEANHGIDNEFDLFKPTINGKQLFKRILIKHKHPMKDKGPRFRILDLFCGAGGMSYGMEQNNNFRTEVALDYNAKALATFKHNMPYAEVVCGDITDKAIQEHVLSLCQERSVNMIIGGPPCQGFSLKGKKLGLNDPRNFLFREYLHFVEILQPEIFFIENVKALLSTSAGWFKDQIIERVAAMGYHVEYGVLNASDFGVPQARQRAIFICSKTTSYALPKPTVSHLTTVREAMSDLAYLNSGEGDFEQQYAMAAQSEYQKMMRRGADKLYNHKASNHAAIAIKKLKMIPPECGKEHLPADMRGRQQFSGTWGRLKWDAVSPTIDTRFDASSNGTNNHPFLHRAITPREAARLQSFDDKFVFIGPKVYIRQQIGNAVPPLMAKALADNISNNINRM